MKTWLIIGCLCLVSFGLRVWKLGSLPSILNRDEAGLAYNAKLLKETGKDEWGKPWPLALQSFGDYKLPGYVWSLLPTFGMFGYSDFATRLPSAVAGTLLIPAVYIFAGALRWSKQKRLLATMLVATTPVFFFYSRIAFEANLALTLFVTSLGIILSETAKDERLLLDGVAIILMLLAVFTYNTPLLLLPFIIVVIPMWRGIKQWRRWLLPVVGLGLVLAFGGLQLVSLSKQKSGITIFQDESTWMRSVENHQQRTGLNRVLFGNKIAFYGSLIAQNYAKTLSPVFLVQGKGGHPWHSLPGAGHLILSTYLLALVGGGLCLVKPTKQRLLLVYLAVVSLIPAVITVDAPHATRSLLFFCG